jgi:hypothetical protein
MFLCSSLSLRVRTYLAFDHPDGGRPSNARYVLLDFFSGTLPLPDLYGISTLPVGTRFSDYEYYSDTCTLTPRLILPDPEVVSDTASAPQERWNYEMMMPEGEVKFKQIVGEAKEMAVTFSCLGIVCIKRPCRDYITIYNVFLGFIFI